MFKRTTGILIAMLLLAATSQAQRREMQKSVIRGDTLYTLLPPGGIPAIFSPEFLTVAEADSVYYDDEPLIVVADGNVAKGYSTWFLDGHEIVNDYINGSAITVTW